MTVSIVAPASLGPAEIARWRELQQASPGLDNPFLSPAFALQVAAVRPRTRVAVFEDAREILAFFPFQSGPMRVGRPLAPGLADCQGMVHVPGFEWDARQLLRSASLEVLELDHLLSYQLPPSSRRVRRADSPVIDLSEGFEAYLVERRKAAKGTIATLERKRRKLERECDEVRLELDDRRPEVLEQLIAWKSAQYLRTGRSDRFGRAWIRSLVVSLFDSREPGCEGRLVTLNADGRPVAALFGLSSQTVLSSWFPGYDPEHGRYSPGLLLFLALAEQAGSGAVPPRLPPRLDLGKGDEDYKNLFANGSVQLAEATIGLGTPLALVRRAQRAPGQALVDFVVSRPALRSRARVVLRELGRLRVRGSA